MNHGMSPSRTISCPKSTSSPNSRGKDYASIASRDSVAVLMSSSKRHRCEATTGFRETTASLKPNVSTYWTSWTHPHFMRRCIGRWELPWTAVAD